MDVNNVSSAEQVIGMSMLKKVMKETLGDGLEFEMVYQCLLDSMNNKSTTEDGKSNMISVGAGQNLESIPIRYLSSLSSLNSSYGDVSSINRVVTASSDETTQRIYNAVNKYSEEFGVDPKLALAVIKAESNFNPNVVSSAGAMGLMQLMPINCQEDGVEDPFNIEQNIKGGVKQLKGHIDRYNGDIEMALMGYNAGPGSVKRRGVTSSAELYKMSKETQNYVPKVMKYYLNGI